MWRLFLNSILALTFTLPSYTWANPSSYDDVWQVVKTDPAADELPAREVKILQLYEGGNFPTYPVSFERFFKKTRDGVVDLLKKSVDRTLNTHQDTYLYFDKLLHSNGICFQGEWRITEANPWTGLFQQNTKTPVIVRASTTLGGVRQDEKRGFAIAIKFFPASSKKQKTYTQNIFLIDTLAGKKMDSIFESTVSNQPDFGISFDFAMGLHVAKTFALADSDPSFRPVDQISTVRANGQLVDSFEGPQGLKLVPRQSLSTHVPSDFRSEMKQAVQKKNVTYEIWASADRPKRSSRSEWVYLGLLTLRDPQITFGCDRRLHFPHPKIDQE